MQRDRAYPLSVCGKRETVGATPASTYETALQVAALAGNKEPLLEVRIGRTTFQALLDTGSSVSLLGAPAARVAVEAGAKPKTQERALRLATGWSQSTTSLKCKIQWATSSRSQHFLCVPDLCRDIVLGRDFLTATGISLHVSLGGWTIGTDPQCMVPFAKRERDPAAALAIEDAESYHLHNLFEEVLVVPDIENMHLATTKELHPSMSEVLYDFSHLFSTIPGCTTLAQHRIDTRDSAPVRCKLRPVNVKKQKIIEGCVDDLLEQGLIRRSTSPWTSAPVLVAKKSGGYRLAVDYRPLNARTRVPAYPMPRTDWLLAQLGRAMWFSSFDLSQGFFQIPVCEADIAKTAFICHQGTFEFTRMPFGVAGGPATFQTLMDRVLQGINHHFAMAFLDDVLVYSETLENHVEHVREVLQRIEAAGLTINPDKMQVCCQSLKFLGHIISPGQCRPDEEKVRAVLDYPRPSTVKQLQAFLGLAGYYRSFIPHFSLTAHPLTNLLKKNEPWQWQECQEQAFTALKQALAQDAVTSLPDLNRPFVVETDASGIGIAAVLLQAGPEGLRPVSFISRVLTAAERHYTVQEWECLAVVWAVDKFRAYLEFTEFEIHCDHSSLAWMFNTDQASPRVKRWVLRLQGFNCRIKHRRGLANIPADALSRAPLQCEDSPNDNLHETLFPIAAPEPEGKITFDEVAVASENDSLLLSDTLQLVQEQARDDRLLKLKAVVQGTQLPSSDPDHRLFRDLAETTELQPNGLLVQQRGNKKVAWLPNHLRQLALKMAHDHPTAGHAGFFKTLRRVAARFVWLGMRADISKYVQCCTVCQRTKARRKKPEGLMSSQWATSPMEELSVDIIGPLPSTPRGHKYLLVVIDKFTKFPELFPLRAATSAKILECMVQVFCRHGTPVAITSDNGKPFVSTLWRNLLKHWGIKDRHTVPYRPAGQMVERHNGTIKQCLRAYCSNHKDWDRHIPEISLAMRTAESVVTGYTPALLCYGRELRTPWEPASDKEDTEPPKAAHHALATELQRCLGEALQYARTHQAVAWKVQKSCYDRHRQPTTIKEGDLVLLDSHTLSDAAKGVSAKLAPRRSGPYCVLKRLGDNDFVLSDPTTGRYRTTAHADQLMLYHEPLLLPTSTASQFEGGESCDAQGPGQASPRHAMRSHGSRRPSAGSTVVDGAD